MHDYFYGILQQSSVYLLLMKNVVSEPSQWIFKDEDSLKGQFRTIYQFPWHCEPVTPPPPPYFVYLGACSVSESSHTLNLCLVSTRCENSYWAFLEKNNLFL